MQEGPRPAQDPATSLGRNAFPGYRTFCYLRNKVAGEIIQIDLEATALEYVATVIEGNRLSEVEDSLEIFKRVVSPHPVRESERAWPDLPPHSQADGPLSRIDSGVVNLRPAEIPQLEGFLEHCIAN